MIATDAAEPALIDCRTAASALYDFLDARLPASAMASVQHHIDLCAQCAPHFAFAREVLSKLPDCLPLDADCAALRARILSSLTSEGFSPP